MLEEKNDNLSVQQNETDGSVENESQEVIQPEVEEVPTTGTGNVVLSNSPTFTGTPVFPAGTTAVTQSPLDSTTAIATTEFVTSAIAVATIPDATTTTKGKLQLAGDLTGTAALPTIAANAVTSAKILDGEIVDADISATAAIADTKLATIATAGKVNNSATTATALNTPNTIVLRDGSGNLAAGAITATGFAGPLTGNVTGNLNGNATTATTAGNITATSNTTLTDQISTVKKYFTDKGYSVNISTNSGTGNTLQWKIKW